MTLVRSSAVDSAVYHRSSSAAIAGIDHHKRKLDDYASFPDYGDLLHDRMKKHEPDAVVSSKDGFSSISGDISGQNRSMSLAAECSCSCESSTRAELETESTRLQFFVRMISEGKTIVVYADRNDTVESLHQRIQLMTGIPVIEQRLIYRGKQLQYEQSLGDYSIEKDASLNLVGRMRSTEHPLAWRVIDDMISTVRQMCRGEPLREGTLGVSEKLTVFLTMLPKDNNDSAAEYLRIFLSSSAPAALVMLYVSHIEGNREHADCSIRHFLTTCRNALPKSLYKQCLPSVLAFCKLLRKFAPDQPLYFSCRSTLGSMLELVDTSHGSKYGNEVEGSLLGQELFPFISELADKLSKDLISSVDSDTRLGPLSSDVRDFSTFLLHLRNAIDQDPTVLEEEIEYLHGIFKDLLNTMGKCLDKIEVWLGSEGGGNNELMFSSCSHYLTILKEINLISKFYRGAEEQLLGVLKSRKASFCALIIRFAKRADDHKWILEHKDVTNFEVRRHLIMMMFPDVKEDYEELHEMLIDRSQLLAESFEYIGRADRESLHGGLFMEFKNEEATGPGVLREWFFLVCQALFNPENALFVSCPVDRRRFYPNPASKVDPMHLEYFTFSGRVIALALMHKVQVGVLFDRVFYLQLAGRGISLEDIRDADPSMYKSCKQILEMDPEFIDSDCLGLTFVREIEELGNRNVVELCPGGKSIAVNSKNRDKYVNRLIEDRFVTSVSEQVLHFFRGFTDILSDPKRGKFFFQSLELEDLDRMLHGSVSAIDLEDWRAHTEYNGYKETDRQVDWFWRIVKGMTEEQQRILLFFWTSIRYLPVEGFRGLGSKLHIYKSYEPYDRLPSSHTCFYRLCLPNYPTYALMEERLKVITQHHVCCSFGTW